MATRSSAISRIIGFVNHAIWQALWQWAARRHPTKPRRWLKDKYFPARQGRKWNFTGRIARADGTQEPVVLIKAADLPIRRYVLVKGKANPFDPQWKEYGERRLRRAREAFHDKQHLAPPPLFTERSHVPGERGGLRGLSRMSGN